MNEAKPETCLHCEKRREEHIGYYCRGPITSWTPDDRPALSERIDFLRERACCDPSNGFGHTHACHQLRERIAEMKAALSEFRRSFAGHVYVKNEDYEELCRKRDRAEKAERERDELKWQVEKWERKEADRAMCCWKNEKKADALEKALRSLGPGPDGLYPSPGEIDATIRAALAEEKPARPCCDIYAATGKAHRSGCPGEKPAPVGEKP